MMLADTRSSGAAPSRRRRVWGTTSPFWGDGLPFSAWFDRRV